MFLQLWWIIGSVETVACQVIVWLLCYLSNQPHPLFAQSIIRHWAQEVRQQPPTIPAISSDMFLLQQIYWHQTRYGNVLWVWVFLFIHLERGGTIGRHFGGERGQAPTGTKVSYTCTYYIRVILILRAQFVQIQIVASHSQGVPCVSLTWASHLSHTYLMHNLVIMNYNCDGH